MKQQQGFTLVEVIFTIAMVVLCSMVIVELFIGQNRIYKLQTAELNITNDARVALDDIDNHVRQAHRVLASYSSYTGGPETLILSIQSINGSNQLISGVYDNVVFYMNGNGFYREVFPHASSARVATLKKLASNVNDLNITYNNADFTLVTEVTTDVTLQEDAGIQDRAITISSKSILRNY